jgi:hypothetical protein
MQAYMSSASCTACVCHTPFKADAANCLSSEAKTPTCLLPLLLLHVAMQLALHVCKLLLQLLLL